MKKILVASSALVAVGFAGAAQASEPISLSVGGYMEQWAGVADQDDAYESYNAFQSDTEVHFAGSTTLDNGIEVGAKIELEGEESDGSQVDEQYLYINGGFGQVKLGQEDGVQTDMLTVAPSTGPVNAQDGDLASWVNINTSDTNVTANIYGYSDAKKVTYYTPVLGGFRAGVSYTDDDTSEHADKATGGDARYGVGVEYSGDFDAVSVKVSGMAEGDGDDGRNYHVGANVGFGAFTVGGSYGAANSEYLDGADNATNGDAFGYDFGVGYAMDAATVTLTYFYGEDEAGSATAEDSLSNLHLGLSYTLGAGVTWKSSVFMFDNERDASGGTDNDGYGAVTGLALSF
ncbi:porin [Thalassospira australica]|uniref:porin n=1 Tax=Thalassospira australica TaxID=1528106 RepID=UPI00051A5837|nr:porin [Thalassospira australica]